MPSTQRVSGWDIVLTPSEEHTHTSTHAQDGSKNNHSRRGGGGIYSMAQSNGRQDLFYCLCRGEHSVVAPTHSSDAQPDRCLQRGMARHRRRTTVEHVSEPFTPTVASHDRASRVRARVGLGEGGAKSVSGPESEGKV